MSQKRALIVDNPVAARLKENHLTRLQNHRGVLITYLRMKTESEDWHGVADAAMDLRELDAELRAHQGTR